MCDKSVAASPIIIIADMLFDLSQLFNTDSRNTCSLSFPVKVEKYDFVN